MDDQIWLALYALSRHMLTNLPPPDTLVGQDSQDAIRLKGALVAIILTTERKFRLPPTYLPRAERKREYA